MALSIDPLTYVITVPKADLALVQAAPTEIRELSINSFRLELKAYEADQDNGIYLLKTHSHNTEVLLGGITYARIVEILAPYTITFEDGQYAVNLAGANSNIGDVINVNQVSVRSQNSAGLISNQAIEFSSFNGGVTVDVNNITGQASSGTVFPIGTRQVPVNNLTDAALIAARRGLSKIFVIGNLTIDDSTDWERFEFVGESALKSVITVLDAAEVLNCEFYDCTVTGVLDGNSQIERSVVNDIDFVDGYIFQCALGPAVISLGTSTNANMFSCYSTVPGSITPEIDMNGTGVLALRDYHGGMTLRNYTGTGSHSIDLASGQIKLDPNTITSGTFVLRGVGKLVDESTGLHIHSGTWNGGVTIINELMNVPNVTEGVWDADAVDYNIADTMGEYQQTGASVDPAAIADAVWDEDTADHQIAGSTGKALTDAGAAGNPWDTPVPTTPVSGSYGEYMTKKLLTFVKWIGLK